MRSPVPPPSDPRNSRPVAVWFGITRETFGTARSTITSAACKYFSNNSGEIVSTSPILSNPSPASSGGNSTSLLNSIPIRSLMVFRYSARLSRRTVTFPGSDAVALRSKASNLIHCVSAAISSADGRPTPSSSGGMMPARTFFNAANHISCRDSISPAVFNPSKATCPLFTPSAWQS